MNLQEQRTIPLVVQTGEPRLASATGNNAAWLCPCGRKLPLVGTTFPKNRPPREVECPECRNLYKLVPEKNSTEKNSTTVLKVEGLIK